MDEYTTFPRRQLPVELALEATRVLLTPAVVAPLALTGVSLWGAALLFEATPYLEGVESVLVLATAAALVLLGIVGLCYCARTVHTAARYLCRLHRWGRALEQSGLSPSCTSAPALPRPTRPSFWTGEVER